MQISWFVWNVFDTSSHIHIDSGDTLFQMAEVHRQIQVQLEDVVSTCAVQFQHSIKSVVAKTFGVSGTFLPQSHSYNFLLHKFRS